jgi:glutamate-1-semialdehyde 2,1-aminomutase
MGSWGTALVGHAHRNVIDTLKETLENGLSFGATHAKEFDLAEEILAAFPGMESIRFVSSGTEACMTAVRLARAYTKRDLIIKFDGHYHGHSDSLLVKAGSGLATLGIPASPGIPEAVSKYTISVSFNDIKALEDVFARYKGQVAAVIFEPIVGNAGFIRPDVGFLNSLRDLCTENGSLLIFDEVMTGFRVAWGGVQTLYNIKADLSTLGKVIGGGMPLAALAGRREIMNHLAPSGNVYQAGTLSGNPVAVAAGLKTLQILKSEEKPYERLANNCEWLLRSFSDSARRYGIPLQVDFEGGMFGFSFSSKKIRNFSDTENIDFECFNFFFRKFLEFGVYLPPSSYEACFMSLAHTKEDLERTGKIFEQICKLRVS